MHIVQSPDWEEFKNQYGTPAIRAGGVLYTKHKIPMTNSYFAYCPKVNPLVIKFDVLKESLLENDCININFDVPDVQKGTPEEQKSLEIFANLKCKKSPRDQFAKANVVLDLSLGEEEILKKMHHKHRYNIRYSQRKEVTVKRAENVDDFNLFYEMFRDTSKRQKYYVRPKAYYQKIWELFGPKEMCYILTSEFKGEPLASWLFLIYDGVLYYPYGGSSEKHRNLHGSTLLGWEGIKLGLEKQCRVFDMWGALENVEDKSSPWWGFTNFKLRFGGQHVVYMDSYDFVVNTPLYTMFNTANAFRWKILGMIK